MSTMHPGKTLIPPLNGHVSLFLDNLGVSPFIDTELINLDFCYINARHGF